ncbi:hypothetical protein [Candidatus Caldatribacterium sp.]|uniref:hypothetical protein n=1 Tax=Candidatus Caldatribacterium sp. TaxID=2282143 RepID=UPI0038445927|nr:hypothetical protein [Candidatus Caldatribacterium sp.]
MMRRFPHTVAFVASLVGMFLLSGCFAPAQFGSPGRAIVRGTVTLPEENRCFGVLCSQSQVFGDHVPVPQAQVILYGENGGLLFTQTDICGAYEIAGARSTCYILYAQVPGGSARVKKGFTLASGGVNDVGEVNVYTTAQVIIYEVAVEMYGKGVVRCSDIPNFIPTPALLEAVRSALVFCRDPQKDCTVLILASIATSYFGASGGSGTTGSLHSVWKSQRGPR